jgi:hypothetical protein
LRIAKEGLMRNRRGVEGVVRAAMTVVIMAGLIGTARAQGLNLEGQSGGLVTPFAYTVESQARGVSLPAVAFHALGGGDVVGTHFQMSVTAGLLRRVEVGITRSAVSEGSVQPLSNLFDRGFTIVHGKALLVPENRGGPAVPAVSVGFLTRYQRKHIEGGLGSATQNADFFAAATKTIGPIRLASLVVSGGAKVTNASIMGFAGDSPDWAFCGFAFAGVRFSGRLLVGAEYAQQPEAIDGMASTDVPGTVTVLARLTPDANGRLSIDAGLISLGDAIGSNLDVDADNRYLFGVGYRF